MELVICHSDDPIRLTTTYQASPRSVYNYIMCRSIKQLRHPEFAPTEEEINAAALQYIRKVSGYRQPSRANQVAFDQAVFEVAQSTRSLIENLRSIAALE